MTFGRELFIDLGSKSVYQHQFDTHRVQDRQVLDKGIELAGGNQLACHADDECLATVGVDIGRDGPKPGNEGVREDQAHGGRDCAAARSRLVMLRQRV